MTPRPPSQRSSGLAAAAYVCGLIGILLPFPVGLIAIILGVAALVRIGMNPGLGGRGKAITGMVLPIAVGGVIWLPIAISVADFIKVQRRGRYSECKGNLKSVFTAETSFYEEKNRYTSVAADVGFSPERGNRYVYILDVTGPVQDRSGQWLKVDDRATSIGLDTFKYVQARPITLADVTVPIAGNARPGVHGQCPDCSFVAVCAGNIDDDDTLDVWSVSTEDRTNSTGERIPAGAPSHDLDDLAD